LRKRTSSRPEDQALELCDTLARHRSCWTRNIHWDVYLLEALTEALQIAFEAAIFSNRFEINEQGPLSRIEALTERLIEGIENFNKNHGAQDIAKAATKSTIDRIASRLRASPTRPTSWPIAKVDGAEFELPEF